MKKIKEFLIHWLGGYTKPEASELFGKYYQRGKVMGEARAANYFKGYMKTLWEDPDWSEKAYRRVSEFLSRDLPESGLPSFE